MTIEINVPDIGSDEVEVTEILVSVGDKVNIEQSLITVEGDKASIEVPSPLAGVVKELKVAVGDKVTTGTMIMIFEEDESSNDKLSDNHFAQSKEVYLPDIGNDKVEVAEILVRIGDKVKTNQSLIIIKNDKVSMEVPAPFAGTVKKIKAKIGDKVNTGSLIMIFESVEDNIELNKSIDIVSLPLSSVPGKNEFSNNVAYSHASPGIRRLAREFGINLAKVKGTGPKGRILREDIQVYVKKVIKHAETTTVDDYDSITLSAILPWPKVDFSKFGNTEEVEIGRIRKISGANLHRNWMMIPHVTQFDEADITDIEAFRKQQNAEAEMNKLYLKITPLVFIMKVVARSLEELPRFNSSLSENAQKLILKKYINIGVAVDTPNGLVVPVLRDVNKKGIVELSRELAEISNKARLGKLTSSDMQGGCFTISNLGSISSAIFTPIINAPEVAILGVSKSSIKSVWNGKEFEPRLILPLSLSYDHRVIDGVEGAHFINLIKKIMSDIRRLVM